MYKTYQQYVIDTNPSKDLSQSITGKLQPGEYTLNILSIIPVRDSIDIILENSFGERFRDRIKVWEDSSIISQELVDFLSPMCHNSLDNFVTEFSHTPQLKVFEGQQVHVVIGYVKGYKVFANSAGNYYYVVDSEGSTLTEEHFSSFKQAKEWAELQHLRPAGLKVTKWMCDLRII